MCEQLNSPSPAETKSCHGDHGYHNHAAWHVPAQFGFEYEYKLVLGQLQLLIQRLCEKHHALVSHNN